MVNKLKKKIATLGLAGALTIFPALQAWSGASGKEIASVFQEPQKTTQQVVEKQPVFHENIQDKITIPFTVKKGSDAHSAYKSNIDIEYLIDKFRGNKDGKLSLQESNNFATAKNPFREGHNNFPVVGNNRLVYNPQTNQIGVIPGVQETSKESKLETEISEKSKKTPQTIPKQSTKTSTRQFQGDILYFPQNFNGHISKIEKNDNNNFSVYDSTVIHQDELLFNKANKVKPESVFLDFITTGLYRPNGKGQTQLVNSYMKAIHDANLNGMTHENVGISAIKLSDLENILGKEILYEDQREELTPALLHDAITYHAIHESVARHFYENQNLGNGYLVDVSAFIERDQLRGFLADNALARIVLPINTILQGSITGYDGTQHDLTDNGIKTGQAILNQRVDQNLSEYENQVYSIINQELGGNKE
ncbi:MAG: hypothetical protein ACOC16_00270 [Nanoarchaeota archaeon]